MELPRIPEQFSRLPSIRLRPYQLILAGMLAFSALFLLTAPPVPADANYKYQVDLTLREYPLVPWTANLVEFSVERVREVYRWNLTSETVTHNMPVLKGTDRALGFASIFILFGCLACISIFFARDRRMAGAGMLVLVIAGSHLLSNAPAYSKMASVPSELIPSAAATLVIKADPGHDQDVSRETFAGLKNLSDRYFDQYVTFTRHRMGEAGPILPELKQVWFGISGVFYVLPFAILLGVLSTIVVLLQTLSWALLLLAPFAIAVAMIDGRAGLKVKEHVVVPIVLTNLLLLLLSPTLPMVLYTATAVQATETQLGLLLVGSLFPVMVFASIIYLLKKKGLFHAVVRHRRKGVRGEIVPVPESRSSESRVFDGSGLPERPVGRLSWFRRR